MQIVRRGLFVLVAAWALAGSAFAADFRDFTPAAFAAAQTEGAPILIVVAADWCPTCRAQEAGVHSIVADHAYDQMVCLAHRL
jgi:thiol:disulfide interchange protein